MASKDMTFCMSDCVNKECPRHLSDKVRESNLPISYADFSKTCKDYKNEDE